MNTIHMRFVKDGKITGYGRVVPYKWLYQVCFQISTNEIDWFESSSSRHDCDLIERGIEVRGEVWYEGDILSFIGKDGRELTGTLAWNEEYMMFVVIVKVGCLDPISLFMFEIKNAQCIGNIHEGEKP
jgi:hypothetical protein